MENEFDKEYGRMETEEHRKFISEIEEFKEEIKARYKREADFKKKVDSEIWQCISCGETMIGLSALVSMEKLGCRCLECFDEKEFEIIPKVGIPNSNGGYAKPPVNSKNPETVSPWNEYAVRCLENK